MVLTNVIGHHHEARTAEGPRNSSMNETRYWFLLSLHWGRNKREILKNHECFGNKQKTRLKNRIGVQLNENDLKDLMGLALEAGKKSHSKWGD